MSLEPAKTTLPIWKGATFRKRITLYDPNGEPRDLTGYTGLLEIRDEPEGAVLISMTDVNGRVVFGGVAGTIDLFLDAATTGALTWDTAVYDFTITAPNGGDTDALLWGKVVVRGI